MAAFDFFKQIFKENDLRENLNSTKTVKLQGMKFKIKKLNILDYIQGQSVALNRFDVWENKKANENKPVMANEAKMNNIKKHYIDVFLSSIIKPELSRKEDDGTKIYVEELFKFGDFEQLYAEIINFTYGKKKIKFAT